MRRIMVLITMVALLAGGGVSTALAIVTDAKIMVGGKAQFVTPDAIQVSVTYVCPASFLTGFVSVIVAQEETGAQGFGGMTVPCTDERETVVVTVTTVVPTYTLGQAIAQGAISGLFFTDTHRRQIQIVL